MMYEFYSKVTMKPHNRDKWWIMDDIIPQIDIEADSLNEALHKFAEMVKDDCYIDISKNAIKNRKPMYIDTKDGTKQCGYVITGKTDFQNENDKWVSQYIDIWTEIIGVKYHPVF